LIVDVMLHMLVAGAQRG